jgi:hypothetical protein
MSGIRVTVTDLDSGESESQEIEDNYLIITAGRCYVAHEQRYPGKGTTILTIKTEPSDAYNARQA